MTTKTPATPLPWRLFEHGFYSGYTVEISPPPPAKLGERPAVVAWSGFDSCGLGSEDQQANAAYIAHAANAYPKLVEFVKKTLGTKYYADQAAALLRSLGEDA